MESIKSITIFSLFFIIFVSGQSQMEIIKSQKEKIDTLNAIIIKLTKDYDKDGVSDYFDKEINTPIGARVDGSGIAIDTDLDGVIDLNDKCVTAPGMQPDGCPVCDLEVEWRGDPLPKVEFEYLDIELSQSAIPYLNNAIRLIQKYGEGLTFSIIGYSNDYNSSKKNKNISKQRVQKVYEYIIEQAPQLKNQFIFVTKEYENIPKPDCDNRKNCVKNKVEIELYER